MKITLTNNYYQGLAVNKNSQNKKNIYANKTVGNGVAFGGPELTRRAASSSAARATQALAQTAQRAVRLFNVECQNSDSKDKVVNINGVVYMNPEYDKNGNIISCESVTTEYDDGRPDKVTKRIFEKPEYDENGNIRSYESVTKEYNGQDDNVTKETFVKPEYDENGNIKSCESATKEYNGQDDNVTKETFVKPRYNEYGDMISCESVTTEYDGRDDNVTKETFVKPRYNEYDDMISCGEVTIEYRGRRDHVSKEIFLGGTFLNVYHKHITEFEDGRIVEESRPC